MKKKYNMISKASNSMDYSSLKETYKCAKNGFQVSGLRIIVNKNDLLKMIKKDNYSIYLY